MNASSRLARTWGSPWLRLAGAGWALALLVSTSAALGQAPAGEPGPSDPISIVRVLPDRIDITFSSRWHLGVGTRLVVERAGALIAELEVTLATERSATCRIERELQPVVIGDSVRPLGKLAQPPQPAEAPTEVKPILVRQVTSEAIYLDNGRAAGLVVGQRVSGARRSDRRRARGGLPRPSHSASCKVISAEATPEAGDKVIPGPPPAPSPETLAQATPPPAATPGAAGTARPAAKATPSRGGGGAHPLSGSVAVRYQGFQDSSSDGSDFAQTAALINLIARGLAGSALELRLRARVGQDQVGRPNGATENRRNDHIYELTLLHETPGDAFTYQVGRLISGPQVGFDYLDGVMGEYHWNGRSGVGGFYGTRSNADEVTWRGTGQAYGAFYHYLNQSNDSPWYNELLVGGIGEYQGGEVNREYLSVYGRQGSGSRWSLYERAELDFNRGYRRANGASTYQLSNLLVSATYSPGKNVRFGITYDERQQYRTLEDRNTPEQLFDDALREGLRVNAYFGSARGLRANLSVGERHRQGSPEKNLTYSASVYHGNVFGWNLLVGSDYSGFSGDTSEGYRAGFRVQKYFGAGHDLELNLGTSATTLLALKSQRKNQWVRLSGTAQLGRRFFLLGEYEIDSGDDFEGQRVFLQLGYRL
ncbi:MAG: hypothetical protein U0002_16960 [Thermoanaerobaculia bacterium]